MLLPPLPMPCLCPADCRLLIVDRIEAGHQAALEFEQREAQRQERAQQQQQAADGEFEAENNCDYLENLKPKQYENSAFLE